MVRGFVWNTILKMWPFANAACYFHHLVNSQLIFHWSKVAPLCVCGQQQGRGGQLSHWTVVPLNQAEWDCESWQNWWSNKTPTRKIKTNMSWLAMLTWHIDLRPKECSVQFLSRPCNGSTLSKKTNCSSEHANEETNLHARTTALSHCHLSQCLIALIKLLSWCLFVEIV